MTTATRPRAATRQNGSGNENRAAKMTTGNEKKREYGRTTLYFAREWEMEEVFLSSLTVTV
jgi:hypothetical protein